MGLRGPKPLISHKEKVEELLKHQIFDDFGKLKKESDLSIMPYPLWDVICKNLSTKHKNELTKRNLYVYLSKNRNNVIADVKHNLMQNNHEASNDNQSLVIETNQFDLEYELLKIQHNSLYKNTIKEFCIFPFIIFYWTNKAIDFVSQS